MDDPDFIPDGRIPELNADMFVLDRSSNSMKTSSQMSPFSAPSPGSVSGAFGNEQYHVQLELRHSSVSAPRAASQDLQGLSSAQKPAIMDNHGDALFEDEVAGPVDYGMEIDEFGNIIEVAGPVTALPEELELPPFPSIEGGEGIVPPAEQLAEGQGNILMMEEPLPDAEAFPRQERASQAEAVALQEQEHQVAPAHRQRQRKVLRADERTEIPRGVIKGWQGDYLDNCTQPKCHQVTNAQARQNAIHLTFGLGIANIGQNLGIPGMIHPLAAQFSGDSLFTVYTGLETLPPKSRGKRTRSHDDPGENEERRVRPRLDDDGNEQARGLLMDEIMGAILGDDQSPPEIGREAGSVLDDRHSSTAPWNRGSSLMPGSSTQKPGSIRYGGAQSSPLQGRGSAQDIVRYSDNEEMGGIEFGGGVPHWADDPFDGMPAPAEFGVPVEEQSQRDTQNSLDRESRSFRTYIEEMIHENGERRHDEDFDFHRKWIDFNDVFVSNKTDRTTAAQAFYHILMLVTKNQMLVEQDDQNEVPFGAIHMGLRLGHDA
jgi:meiotic recombination protein REC8, fungi type